MLSIFSVHKLLPYYVMSVKMLPIPQTRVTKGSVVNFMRKISEKGQCCYYIHGLQSKSDFYLCRKHKLINNGHVFVTTMVKETCF
jgi:hypothetical protein